MSRQHVLVIGSGFAGLWAALGAARRLDELGVRPGSVRLTMLSRAPFHDIRVRNYEADLRACRIPLADLLEPAGVGHIADPVCGIDTDARTVTTAGGVVHGYDRLVLAAGSQVVKPDIPGLQEFGFDVDSYDGAVALDRHLRALAATSSSPGATTAVVVGAGLTGIEVACELPSRMPGCRVVLIDHNFVGSDMGVEARPVIEAALADNGVATRTGIGVESITGHAVTLSTGEVLPAATVIWCAGMRASPLTGQLPVTPDRLGRVPVDDYLRVRGVPALFAAGDVAAAALDGPHLSVMSCQHARPMGRYGGYNVISDLLGEPMLALRIPWYVTVLDLGPAGAVYTEGWDRRVVADGAAAKDTKRVINTERIYPPLSRDRSELLAAAAAQLQVRPALGQ